MTAAIIIGSCKSLRLLFYGTLRSAVIAGAEQSRIIN